MDPADAKILLKILEKPPLGEHHHDTRACTPEEFVFNSIIDDLTRLLEVDEDVVRRSLKQANEASGCTNKNLVNLYLGTCAGSSRTFLLITKGLEFGIITRLEFRSAIVGEDDGFNAKEAMCEEVRRVANNVVSGVKPPTLDSQGEVTPARLVDDTPKSSNSADGDGLPKPTRKEDVGKPTTTATEEIGIALENEMKTFGMRLGGLLSNVPDVITRLTNAAICTKLREESAKIETRRRMHGQELVCRDAMNQNAGSSSPWVPPVTQVAFSPLGDRIAGGYQDGKIVIWEFPSGNELMTVTGHHRSGITSISFSRQGDRLVSGAFDATVRLWDVQLGLELKTMKGHSTYVHAVAISMDGTRIVSGSQDNTIMMWNSESGTEIFSISEQCVLSLAFSPNGTRFVSGGHSHIVKLWDSTNGKEIMKMQEHAGIVLSVAYSPDGKKVVSTRNELMIISDSETGVELRVIKGTYESSLTFSTDGKYILSGSATKTIKLWNSRNGVLLKTKTSESPVNSVSFHPSGEFIAFCGDGGARILVVDETWA